MEVSSCGHRQSHDETPHECLILNQSLMWWSWPPCLHVKQIFKSPDTPRPHTKQLNTHFPRPQRSVCSSSHRICTILFSASSLDGSAPRLGEFVPTCISAVREVCFVDCTCLFRVDGGLDMRGGNEILWFAYSLHKASTEKLHSNRTADVLFFFRQMLWKCKMYFEQSSRI